MLLLTLVGEMVRVAADVLRWSERDSLRAAAEASGEEPAAAAAAAADAGDADEVPFSGEAVTTVAPAGGQSCCPVDESLLRFSGQSRCFCPPASLPLFLTWVVMSSAPPPRRVVVVPPEADAAAAAAEDAEGPSPVPHLVKVTSDSLLSSGATLVPAPPAAGGED